ncbi:MAG: mechanosensitive ion channel family protein [Lachnospiraceae bacterium]|nr:mechanosensitive ion channel family protein [Lachnospiraceae bacterium]
MIEEFLNELPSKALNFGMKVLLCIVLFLIGVKIIQLVRKMLRRSMEKAGAEEGVRSFVDSFVKAALYVLLGFVLLSWFGVDTASIVALVGSAGVAIGLAIQGSLSNLAGGVLIMLLKPFKVGDFIREDTHGNMGTVTEIQIFYTKLSTVDNQVVVLPNGSLANTSLTNASGNRERRMDVKVGISYAADLKKAKEVLFSLLEENAQVIKEMEYWVFVDELADSAVILNMRCYFPQEVFWEEKWRMTENAKLALDEAGIEIAYPQLDVHMK